MKSSSARVSSQRARFWEVSRDLFAVVKNKDVKSFTISRSKWLRGTNDTCLLNAEGKMCCLGFYALACFLQEKDIFERFTPEEIYDVKQMWDSFLVCEHPANDGGGLVNSKTCTHLMDTNDGLTSTDDEKEKEIVALFKSQGVDVTFVD